MSKKRFQLKLVPPMGENLNQAIFKMVSSHLDSAKEEDRARAMEEVMEMLLFHGCQCAAMVYSDKEHVRKTVQDIVDNSLAKLTEPEPEKN